MSILNDLMYVFIRVNNSMLALQYGTDISFTQHGISVLTNTFYLVREPTGHYPKSNFSTDCFTFIVGISVIIYTGSILDFFPAEGDLLVGDGAADGGFEIGAFSGSTKTTGLFITKVCQYVISQPVDSKIGILMVTISLSNTSARFL